MIIRFFKKNQIASVVVISLVAIALWLPAFINPIPMALVKTPMPLFGLIEYGVRNYPFIYNTVALLLIIVEAFFLNYILTRNNVVEENTYLAAFIYMLLMSSDKTFLTLHPLIFSNFFLLLVLYKLINTYRKEEAFSEVFDAAFFLSIASLFYFPSLVMFPVIWVILLFIRPFVWREWVISIVGLGLPYLFVFVYYFWMDELKSFLFEGIILTTLYDKFNTLHIPSTPILIYVFILLFIFMIALIKQINKSGKSQILARNTNIFFISFLVFALLSYLVAPELKMNYLSFAVIPFSTVVSNYLVSEKKMWRAELLFLLLLASILYCKIEGET